MLALCLCISIVPCFAIQSSYYEGQAMLHVLGGRYQVELMGLGSDALVTFDTLDMYWFDDGSDLGFDSTSSSLTPPDVFTTNHITVDREASLVYNDLLFAIDYPSDFPTEDSGATTYMISDRFILRNDTARLGLHLNPVLNTDTSEYLYPAGSVLSGQVTFYALTTQGDIIEQTIGRDDLVVGSTLDLMPRFLDFKYDVVGVGTDNVAQYYWIEYEGEGVVPTFVHDITFNLGIPQSNVVVVDYETNLFYGTIVDYSEFNLLQWLGSAIDGFLTTTVFTLGDINVTLGAIVSIPLTIMILIVFLKKFAGG